VTSPFSLTTSVSYQTSAFPLSDDVHSLYLKFFANMPRDLVASTFDFSVNQSMYYRVPKR